ncbi:mediator of RNA polymerase II transcription subunit 15-like [Oscarella lobularis]|uniref:mediator of RNA polymerase II transcription subunit 15-like n=1 Tax=Oscarella lobularis TaxID=121494 RepID=UPI003314027D
MNPSSIIRTDLREVVRRKLDDVLKAGRSQGAVFPGTGESLELEIYNKSKAQDDYIKTVQKVLERLTIMKNRAGQQQQQQLVSLSQNAGQVPIYQQQQQQMTAMTARPMPSQPMRLVRPGGATPGNAVTGATAPFLFQPPPPMTTSVMPQQQPQQRPPPSRPSGIQQLSLQSTQNAAMQQQRSYSPSPPMVQVPTSNVLPPSSSGMRMPEHQPPQPPQPQPPLRPQQTQSGSLIKPSPSPSSGEDLVYTEMRKELSGYAPMVKRVIKKSELTAISKDELEKLKSLLNIISNPEKKTSLEVLRKCKNFLERQLGPLEERETPVPVEGAGPPVVAPPPPAPTSSGPNIMTSLLRIIGDDRRTTAERKSVKRSGHSMCQSVTENFGMAVEILNGPIKKPMNEGDEPFPDARLPPPKITPYEEDVMVLETEMEKLKGKFGLKMMARGSEMCVAHLALECTLAVESNCKQVLVVEIPRGYPINSPHVPFPRQSANENAVDPLKVHKLLIVQMIRLEYFTLSQLLSAWESIVMTLLRGDD